MHPALLYSHRGPLAPAELSSLRLDGLLYEIGDAYLPADVPETAEMRALTLTSLVREDCAVTGPMAAWVHGAGDAAPFRCDIRPWRVRRPRQPANSRVRLHDGLVPDTDVVIIAGVGVLTTIATLIDLARSSDATTDRARWLRALVEQHPPSALEARERLRAHERLPGKRRAIASLEKAYDEVTR